MGGEEQGEEQEVGGKEPGKVHPPRLDPDWLDRNAPGRRNHYRRWRGAGKFGVYCLQEDKFGKCSKVMDMA